MAPDEKNKNWERFQCDSIIYSIFGAASCQQSSLRDVAYKGRNYDIPNEFFWMPVDAIRELANTYDDHTYEDCVQSDERFVCRLLQKGLYGKLSPAAKAVLDKAVRMTEESFPYRAQFDLDHPEYQIRNFDCGYYQLKALWKEYMPDDFAEFRGLVKALGDELRPLVYEVGFLRR